MSSHGIRRFPLVWAALAVVAGSGILTGLTEVAGLRAGSLALQGLLLVLVAVAMPLGRLAADRALPTPVVAVSALVALSGCVWTLAFPNDQGDAGTHAGLPALLGHGGLTGAQAGTWSTIAWAALVIGAAAGVANWRRCVTEARRRAAARQTR